MLSVEKASQARTYSDAISAREKKYYIVVKCCHEVLLDAASGRAILEEWQAAHYHTSVTSQYFVTADIQLLDVGEYSDPIDAHEWVNLRDLLSRLPELEFHTVGRALQLSRWLRDHQFCGRCGHPTLLMLDEPRRVCEGCDISFYPRISPCVIGLIHKGDYCLLARGERHPQGLFSTLAGFIEAGENAEEAFVREVKEEVGVNIGNIRYFGSQPWPFPGQLMIGFTAEYASGDIVLEDPEITEADWFHYKNLPEIPSLRSISGQIINSFINSRE